jgi:hypothetical protein
VCCTPTITQCAVSLGWRNFDNAHQPNVDNPQFVRLVELRDGSGALIMVFFANLQPGPQLNDIRLFPLDDSSQIPQVVLTLKR